MDVPPHSQILSNNPDVIAWRVWQLEIWKADMITRFDSYIARADPLLDFVESNQQLAQQQRNTRIMLAIAVITNIVTVILAVISKVL